MLLFWAFDAVISLTTLFSVFVPVLVMGIFCIVLRILLRKF